MYWVWQAASPTPEQRRLSARAPSQPPWRLPNVIPSLPAALLPLLQRRGLKLNPVTTLYYIAPCCFCFLLVPFAFIEAPRILNDPHVRIDPFIFLSNAAAAFGGCSTAGQPWWWLFLESGLDRIEYWLWGGDMVQLLAFPPPWRGVGGCAAELMGPWCSLLPVASKVLVFNQHCEDQGQGEVPWTLLQA